MDTRQLAETIELGENVNTEFKRCGSKPERDTFETVCSFANTFGGSIYLGVEDSGEVVGLPEDGVMDIKRNVINVVNNPNMFDVPPVLEMEDVAHEGKLVVRLWVPPSPNIHRLKGVAYERIGDVDVAVRTVSRLADICIRKQGMYTEQRVYKHVSLDDLQLDLLDDVRSRAAHKRADHEWQRLGDEELLRSAGLLGKDFTTGDVGLNLAAIVLLGKPEVIRSVCPPYKTDAIWRVDPNSRYDDRETVRTNLIEAYGTLSNFCRKHMPDRFALDGDEAISLRDGIVRELVTNCLIHREFSSPYPARITIDSGRIVTENASRAMFEGPISPDGFTPLPKNPLIASFFSNIGLAEELGSGTRNLFRYSPRYSGKDPVLLEGTVFKATVPLYDGSNASSPTVAPGLSGPATEVARLLVVHGELALSDVVEAGISRRTAQRALSELVEANVAMAVGNGRARKYVLSGTAGPMHD